MWQRIPEFWARVRTINWIVGAVGFAYTGMCFLGSRPRPVFRPYPLPAQAGLARTPVSLPRDTVNYLAFTGDSRTLIGSGSVQYPNRNFGKLRAWDVATGKTLWETFTSQPVMTYATHTLLMPDRLSLVTVDSPAVDLALPQSPWDSERRPRRYRYLLTLSFRDARTGQQRNYASSAYETERRVPVSIDVSPDSQSVAVASEDRIDVWQFDKETNLWNWHTLARSADRKLLPISRAQFTADGKKLVVLSADWDLPTRTDEERVIYSYADVYDVLTGQRLRTLGQQAAPKRGGKQFHPIAVMAALSPDRRRIVLFSGKTRRFTLRDVETGNVLSQSPPTGHYPITASFNLTFLDSQVPSRSDPGTVAVKLIEAEPRQKSFDRVFVLYWDLLGNQVWRPAPSEARDAAQTGAVSPDGRLAATPGAGRGNHAALLRDVQTGRLIGSLD